MRRLGEEIGIRRLAGNRLGAPHGASGGMGNIDSIFDSDANTIFQAFTTAPTTSRKVLINAAVLSLKSAGIWAKLDILYVFAAANSQAALINWKNPGTFNAAVVGAPTFTSDAGFTAGGVAYVRSNFVPSTASGNYVRNSAHAAAYILNNVTEATRAIGNGPDTGGYAADLSMEPRKAGNLAYFAINDLTGLDGTASSDSRGHWVVNRSAASACELYRNGASIATNAVASTANLSQEIGFGNYYGTISTHQFAAGHCGSSLSATEAADANTILGTYLTAVGAI